MAARIAGGSGRVAALRRAAELFDGVGAVHDGRAVRRQLRELGVRTGGRGTRRRPASGWESLTRAERAVAELVAAGLSNGEIAVRLYVSKRTVEAHLSRVYTKLQVNNRVAIANVGRAA
jgi:DNA-binding CsgD family transcriptional regulator